MHTILTFSLKAGVFGNGSACRAVTQHSRVRTALRRPNHRSLASEVYSILKFENLFTRHPVELYILLHLSINFARSISVLVLVLLSTYFVLALTSSSFHV